MPKSSAERARVYIARKRQRAREAGLCARCCKEKPEIGLVTCAACNAAALQRSKNKRKRDREAREVQRILQAHERAGDISREHHLYDDAAQRYRDALVLRDTVASRASTAGASDPDADRTRLSEKLAYALSLGRTPQAATPLFDRVLTAYRTATSDAAKTVEILLQRARQLWFEIRLSDAIPLLEQAVEIAEIDGNVNLRLLANARIADYLHGLSRYREAAVYVQAVDRFYDFGEAAAQSDYFMQKGIFAAANSREEDAFQFFERAIHTAKQESDLIYVEDIWETYASWAELLGKTELAKTCRESALLVARESHIMWLISSSCLRYAGLLSRLGQYGSAYEYLLEAVSYDAGLRGKFRLIYYGIPLALQMKDEITLEKCADLEILKHIFRFGAPFSIATATASFAEWHAAAGRDYEAKALLSQALKKIGPIEEGHLRDLPLAVARFGEPSDAPAARKLLQPGIARLGKNVERAYLSLFDAYVAGRTEQSDEELTARALEAIRGFRELGWHHYANLALSLLPRTAQLTNSVHVHNGTIEERNPFADVLLRLTSRERQIAELVLKGYSNRAIAHAFKISERTVEAHMTSIMNQLGVRSRYELNYLRNEP